MRERCVRSPLQLRIMSLPPYPFSLLHFAHFLWIPPHPFVLSFLHSTVVRETHTPAFEKYGSERPSISTASGRMRMRLQHYPTNPLRPLTGWGLLRPCDSHTQKCWNSHPYLCHRHRFTNIFKPVMWTRSHTYSIANLGDPSWNSRYLFNPGVSPPTKVGGALSSGTVIPPSSYYLAIFIHPRCFPGGSAVKNPGSWGEKGWERVRERKRD